MPKMTWANSATVSAVTMARNSHGGDKALATPTARGQGSSRHWDGIPCQAGTTHVVSAVTCTHSPTPGWRISADVARRRRYGAAVGSNTSRRVHGTAAREAVTVRGVCAGFATRFHPARRGMAVTGGTVPAIAYVPAAVAFTQKAAPVGIESRGPPLPECDAGQGCGAAGASR